ncbi:MAG: hypothetical protein ACOC1D_02695 [Prolixibacteraceae bacterium]
MKKFLKKIIIATVILSLTGGLMFYFFLPEYYLPVLPYALLFFLVVTVLIHLWQLNLAKKDPVKFSRYSMLITFLKLVIYSAFAIIYIAGSSENLLVFVIAIMVFYIVFTTIEVWELMRVTKKN